MNRKQFLETVEAAPIAETGSRYAPNPNLLKIFDDAKSKERGGYTVKVRLLPADVNSSIQRIPESAYHTWGTGKTFRFVVPETSTVAPCAARIGSIMSPPTSMTRMSA